MLQFPAWKIVLIVLVCLIGVVFAFPNTFYSRVEQANDAQAEVARGEALTAERQAAIDGWPSFLPSGLINLGLDLRGGAHLLVEVAVEDVYGERTEALWPELRDDLRGIEGIGRVIQQDGPADELRVSIENTDLMPQALEAARALTQPVVSITGVGSFDYIVSSDGDQVVMALSDAEKTATDDRTMQQSLEIIRRRVDESGTREPTIQRQGADRILGAGARDRLRRRAVGADRPDGEAGLSHRGRPDGRPEPARGRAQRHLPVGG